MQLMRPIRPAKPLFLVLLLLLLVPLGVAGCVVAPETQAPTYDQETLKAEKEYQHTLAFKKRLAPSRRLQKISWPILASNVELCGEKVRHSLPLIFTQRDQVPRSSRQGWTGVFGDTDRPVVFAVLDAALEGEVQEGWEVLEFSFAANEDALHNNEGETTGTETADTETEDTETEDTETEGSNFARGLSASFAAVAGEDATNYAQELEMLDQAARSGGSLSLSLVDESGAKHSLDVPTRETCDYPVLLNDDDTVNAFADGRAIYINQGLMKQAPDDLSLAIVVGHELAHNTRDHIPAKITNTVIGGILGGILGGALDDDHIDTGIILGAGLGSNAHSQDFENEADYVGLYHTARAGWDVSQAGDTWRWFGSSFPGMIGLRRGATHPSSVERYLNVDKTAQEIAAKQARGEALIPGAGAGSDL